MYSPVSVQPHVRHLKQLTCHCRSSASRDWPCLISSPQPAQSGGDERRNRTSIIPPRSASWESHCPCQMELPEPGYRTTWSSRPPPVCVCVCVCGCREWGHVLQHSAGGQHKSPGVFSFTWRSDMPDESQRLRWFVLIKCQRAKDRGHRWSWLWPEGRRS